MCLITFAYKIHPNYKLLLIANRDEFYNRPTAPAHPWDDNPSIIGGRDLQAGGGWLGISKQGRFACVTNFREGKQDPAPHSRGMLVTDFLNKSDSPQAWITANQSHFSSYNGFNLLLGTYNNLYYTSKRTDLTTPLSPGIYSLSNHLLDSPWPKSKYAKEQLKQLIEKENIDLKEMIVSLKRNQPFEDKALPATGLPLEMERTLSAPFIQTTDYGTRCTTAIAWRYNGQIDFAEQSYLPEGVEGQYLEYQINL